MTLLSAFSEIQASKKHVHTQFRNKEYYKANQLIQRKIGSLKYNIQLEINRLSENPVYQKLSKKRSQLESRILESRQKRKSKMICSIKDIYAHRSTKPKYLIKLEKVKKEMNDFEYEISLYEKELIEYKDISRNNQNISNTIIRDYLSGELNFLSTWRNNDHEVAIFFNDNSLIENTYRVLQIIALYYITYRDNLDVNQNIDSIAYGFFYSCLKDMASIVDDVNENDHKDLKNKSYYIAILAKYIWYIQNMKGSLDNVLQTNAQ